MSNSSSEDASQERELSGELSAARRHIVELQQELEVCRETLERTGRLARALESGGVAAWEWDLCADVVTCSSSLLILLAQDERLGEGVGEIRDERLRYSEYSALIPASHRAAGEAERRRTVEAGIPYRFEFSIETPSGVRWLVERASPVRDAAGRITHLAGVVGDVSERKAQEQRLAESEARFRAFADAAFEGIAFSVSGQVIDANDTICEMFGYPPGGLVGARVAELVHPDDVPLVRANMLAGYEKTYHHRVVRRDGEIIEVEARGRMVTYRGERARITALRDVTEQRKLERERSQLEEQLRQAQKMEAVGQLAGGIAHDFNNVLTVVLCNLEIASADLTSNPESARACLEEAEASAHKAASLTDQLLTFARRRTTNPKPLSLRALLVEAETMLKRLIPTNVELSVECTEERDTVLVDAGLLQHVIVNLVINARDAMPTGGSLRLRTECIACRRGELELHPEAEGSQVLLTVQDTGAGMPSETLSRMFEPFFTTKRPGKGTGLGLSMAYGIVQQSGGHIAASSRPGHGTRMEILLPACAAPPETSTGGDVERGVPGGAERILLCEDDDSVRVILARLLRLAGYDVVESADGDSAIQLGAGASHIDLLITDVVMPGASGPLVSAELSRHHTNLRTLYCTGYAPSLEGQASGSTWRLLNKPFTRNTLLRQVRKALELASP